MPATLLSDTLGHILVGAGTLAYRPFIDPIDELFDAQRLWFLFLVPLALFISISYKAVRVPDFKNYWREVFSMTILIIISIIALGAASFVLLHFVIPHIVPMK